MKTLMSEIIWHLYRHFSIICFSLSPYFYSLPTIFSILSFYSLSPLQVSFLPFFHLILFLLLFIVPIPSCSSIFCQSPRLPIRPWHCWMSQKVGSAIMGWCHILTITLICTVGRTLHCSDSPPVVMSGYNCSNILGKTLRTAKARLY